MLNRIAIVGPESTGKTTLAEVLSSHYHTVYVPEFCREYLLNINRNYEYEDLVEIAKGQVALEDKLAAKANNKVLICDTNLLVIKIWSEFAFKKCDPWILQEIEKRKYELTFLTYFDIPWTPDPLREHPFMRAELYDIYVQELTKLSIEFNRIKGDYEERKKTAIALIDDLLVLTQ
jgi:NadR type nicotinamide-nucleotide adenylyltransferase